jgi:hypothetical protein
MASFTGYPESLSGYLGHGSPTGSPSGFKGSKMKVDFSSLCVTLVALGVYAAQSVAGQPLAMYYGSDWRKMSPGECAARAVEAMGTKEKFIQAEIQSHEIVFGFTENAAAMVVPKPARGGVQIHVVVAGKDRKDADRLGNAIRSLVLDGPHSANAPAKIVTTDARRRAAAPRIQFGGDVRPISRAEFSTAAATSMQRQGMRTTLLNHGSAVSATDPERAAVAFYVEAKPGAGYVGVAAAAWNSQQAERLRNVLREDIFNKRLPKPWAVILCRFSDLPNEEPYPPSFYEDSFTEAGAGKGLEFDYFRQVTYGAVDMTGSKVYGWFPMPKHSTKDLATLKYPQDRHKLVEWGAEVAKDNHIDLKPFYGVLVFFNSPTDSGSAGGHRIAMGYKGKDWCPTTNVHELGHGFTLKHTWSARPDVVYGDRWDIMSAMRAYTFRNQSRQRCGPGMTAFNLRKLGAILPDRIWDATNKPVCRTISLAALNRPDAEGYLMASIPPAEGSTSTTSYLVEFRQKKAWDIGIPQDTVLVHEVRSNGLCYILSRTNGTDPKSFQVLPGDEFTIPERKLTIKVLSFDAAAGIAEVVISTEK